MSSVADSQLLVPKSWDAFEEMCADLFEREWQYPNTERYGRQGQRQNGVDIYGRRNGAGHAGIQCKGKAKWPPKKLTVSEIDREVAKALKFQPKLTELIFTTTAENDVTIQDHVHSLTEKHEQSGLFSVHVYWWSELTRRLNRHDDLIRKHFGYGQLGQIEKIFDALSKQTVKIAAGLDGLSEKTLREAGEISDEHENICLNDLYITRDCETEIVDAIRDRGQTTFITGLAGCGKTSILWRVAKRLIADGANIFFFRADYVVSDDGFEKVWDIPFSTHPKSYVIVDTVDSVVGQSVSRRRLEDLFQEFRRKGYGVVAAIRPAEKNRFFLDERSIAIPNSYNDREFSRVVESHVKAFYRLKGTDTIAARVEEIKAVASGNTPVVELVYHPLTLRMLFAVYAPTEIPAEVNAISLYLEFWRKRVETDWRAGRPDPDPNSRNLSKAAAWMAATMLMDGVLQVGRDQINLAISQGRIGQEDVPELATRGILHRITTGIGHEGYEFFHQTFFEFAAAWAIVAGESDISMRELYSHLRENQFDSLRIPVIQHGLALGQLMSGKQNSTAKDILNEILEQQPENLLYSALFAVAQQPTLDSATEMALKAALQDRKNAALFVRMTPSTPVQRLQQIWSLFEELYIFEQTDEPERRPRAVRVAIMTELPRIVGRAPSLIDRVLAFIKEQAVVESIASAEISGIGIELKSLATLLFETSRARPDLSSELFLEGCRRLRAREQKQNKSLTGFTVTYCQSEFVPKRVLAEVASLVDGIEDAKIDRVRAFLNARAWDENNGRPYWIENLSDITSASHVQLIQSWSRGKPYVVWEDLWKTFAALCEANHDNGLFMSVWVRELWENLDKHPLEPGSGPSHRAFEFLTETVTKSLESSDQAVQFAARKTCTYLRSQDVLSEIYTRLSAKLDRLAGAAELVEAFLPAMIRKSERFEAHMEPFKSALSRKSARKKVIVSAASLISERPELWRGLTDFLVEQGEFHLLEVPIANGEIRAQPLSERASKLLKLAIEADLASEKVEDRHRAARIAHMALSGDMGLVLRFAEMKRVFEVETDPRAAAWIAMCNMEVALSRDEVESAYRTLLQVCADGDQYVRDRATGALIRAISQKEVPLQVDEFLAAMRANVNLRKLCAAAKIAGAITHSDPEAAGKIARFVLLDPFVNGIGKTVLISVRIQARIPLMLWARNISEAELLELIHWIPRLDAEIALLIADISLHSRYKDKAVVTLQEFVRSDILVPELARGIGSMVRSRTANIQPLHRRAAA